MKTLTMTIAILGLAVTLAGCSSTPSTSGAASPGAVGTKDAAGCSASCEAGVSSCSDAAESSLGAVDEKAKTSECAGEGVCPVSGANPGALDAPKSCGGE